ncbi:hypothetical protein ACO0SA_000799 [Hanseniaspora valbyensis]
MSEEAADFVAQEAATTEPVEEKQDVAIEEKSGDDATAAPSNNFYSFFNKVDTFISSTAHQIQSQIPPIDSGFLEREKESINKNIQKNFFKINEKMKTTNVVVDEEFQATKLPDAYIKLEKQSDDLGKILKKLITILETYEVEGYDYPPSLTDGLNEVWKVTNKFKLWNSSKDVNAEEEAKYAEDQGFLPRSFAQALANTFSNCHKTLSGDKHVKAEEEEDNEEDEGYDDLLKMFSSLKDANTIIDEQKENQDNLIKSEILPALKEMYNETYKNLKAKRSKVENLRIELDSLRYTNEKNDDSLEDQFINETTITLTEMQSFVESINLIKLMKSYNQIQLNYYKKCVEEYQKSLSLIESIEAQYEDEE